jgi:hypothetical protein
MKNLNQSLCVALGLCSLCQLALAGTFEWQADWGVFPNQLTNGMLLHTEGHVQTPVLVNGYLIISNAYVADRFYYYVPATNVAIPTNLTIEAEMRFVGGNSQYAYLTCAAIAFTTQTNAGNVLWIGPNEIFMATSPSNQMGAIAHVDTTSDFHLYRIEVDGTNTGNAVRVYQDGVLQLTSVLDDDTEFNGSVPRIDFGDTSQYASGYSGGSDWESFSNNAVSADSYYPPGLEIGSDRTLTLHGLLTKSYLVMASTNLTINSSAWDTVTNVTLEQLSFPFVDPDASNFTMRFYRAVQSP